MIITLNFKGVGIKFNLKRHCDFSAFYQVFVENSYNNLLECMGKGDIVVDAGANNGVFHCYGICSCWQQGQGHID